MSRAGRWIIVAVVAVLLVVGLSALGAVWAKGVVQTAKLGKAQVTSGAKRLASKDAEAAADDFRNAQANFESVSKSLGPAWVAKTVTAIPWIGRQYEAASALAQVGVDGSRAGLELSLLIAEAPKNAGKDALSEQLTAGRPRLVAALTALNAAAIRVAALSPEGLVSPLSDYVTQAQSAVAGIGPFLKRLPALLALETYLTSAERRILVVSQDGAELRPTGGWAGSYGIVNVGPKGVKLDSYHDVFVLPDPPGRVPMPEGARQTNDFNFRNANWWLDYPTSAAQMLSFWDQYKQKPVDGIVVIDTVTIAELLRVVGPIEVPEFKQTFTADNVLDKLITMTQVERGGQADRKDVLVAMSKRLEQRLKKASPEELAKVARVLGKAADEKHIQMYFTDPDAQAAAVALGWSGKVSPPDGTTDMVAVSNAMNKPGKANVLISKTIEYAVGLDADGSAETTLTLGYTSSGAFPYPKVPNVFRDWLRVYRLPGTEFLPNPTGAPTRTAGAYSTSSGSSGSGTEFGFPAEVRQFVLTRGKSHEEVLLAKVPKAVQADGDGRDQYQLYFVRQADLREAPTKIVVTAPEGGRIVAASARYLASDEPVAVKSDAGSATLSAPLKGDLVVVVSVESK